MKDMSRKGRKDRMIAKMKNGQHTPYSGFVKANKLKWGMFLHFYQPFNQHRDIVEAVVNQCYGPIFEGLLSKKDVKITVNVSGALLEVLDRFGFDKVIQNMSLLYKKGFVEFTSTSCYHAFLPMLPDNEVVRQITLNDELLNKYIFRNSKPIKPLGFFPPEMAVSDRLMTIVSDLGYKYVILDEISCNVSKTASPNNMSGEEFVFQDLGFGKSLFQYANTQIYILFRKRNPSNVMMSGLVRKASDIVKVIRSYKDQNYIITAMDGETFGHHRIGAEKTFLNLFELPKEKRHVEYVFLSELLNQDYPIKKVSVFESTWASSYDDINKGIQFISWKDPDNIIHSWQWELVNLVIEVLSTLDKNPKKPANYEEIRKSADKALASDQFFWASAKPWWSLEMIEQGAYLCLKVIEDAVRSSEIVPQNFLNKAKDLYMNIVSLAFEWQRSGKIREMNAQRNQALRIPFRERTLESGGEYAYRAFLDMMKKQEKLAAKKGDYERAILWRDAIYKIEHKNDIFDSISAVDLLRVHLGNEIVEKVLKKYEDKYKRYKQIKGGQPEQRSN